MSNWSMHRWGVTTAAIATLVASAISPAPAPAAEPTTGTDAAAEQPPSVVMIVMDDYSMDLLKYMPAARKLAKGGATFRNSFVADSLCCTSRTSLYTGRYPHNTHVLTNAAPNGGWHAFKKHHNGKRTYAMNVKRKRPIVRTGLVGKFLNGYKVKQGQVRLEGFDFWDAVGAAAYDGWDYSHITNPWEDAPVTTEQIRVQGIKDRKLRDQRYSGTQIQKDALRFIDDVEQLPYQLTVTPYAAHQKARNIRSFNRRDNAPTFPPAFRDRPTFISGGNCGLAPCPTIKATTLAGFRGKTNGNRPTWANGRPAKGFTWLDNVVEASDRKLNRWRQERAMMASGVSRTLGKILEKVDTDEDYVILTSDNGFHIGQHGRVFGKGTPYDHDIRVPLIIDGPGVKAGTYRDMVSNVDLAPTLDDISNVSSPKYRDGRSLLPLLRSGPGRPHPGWRSTVLVEHTRGGTAIDRDARSIPTYTAVRTADKLLVRYPKRPTAGRPGRHAYELYDGLSATFPYERKNVLRDGVSRDERKMLQRLNRRLNQLKTCRGTKGAQRISCFL